MIANIEMQAGLYRLKENNTFRFFRIYINQQKILKIKEYKNGDLHQCINKFEGGAAIKFIVSIKQQLELWQ